MAKKAKKIDNSHRWVIGAIILIILGAIGWKYFGDELTSPMASTAGFLSVHNCATDYVPGIVMGGTKQRHEATYCFWEDSNSPQREMLLRGFQVRVVERVSHVEKAYLKMRGGSTILATTIPTADPTRAGIFLKFKFQQPILLPHSNDLAIDLLLDHGSVGGIVKNDQSYYATIEKPTDVWAMWKDDSREVPVVLSYWVRSHTSYLFETVINFAANPNTPTGKLVREPNQTIAKVDIFSNPPIADVGFYGKNRNFLKVRLSSDLKKGARTKVYLKDDKTGKVIDAVDANLSSGVNVLTYKLNQNNLIAPIGSKATFSLVTDTTSLIGQVGQKLYIHIGTAETLVGGLDKYCLGWGIDGVGNYNHCDYLLKGYGGTLEFIK